MFAIVFVSVILNKQKKNQSEQEKCKNYALNIFRSQVITFLKMNKIQTDKILTRSLNVDYSVTMVAINSIFGVVLEVINPHSKTLLGLILSR